MEVLEPEIQRDMVGVQVIEKLFELLIPPTSPQSNLTSGFRRFVALVSVIRPDLLEGRSQIQIGKELGCSSANISKEANKMADLLGIRSPGMKRQEARAAMAQGQRGRARGVAHGETAQAAHDRSVMARCESAAEKFMTGQAWTKRERAALRERGFIDEDEDLTEEGRRFMGGDCDTPPYVGNP